MKIKTQYEEVLNTLNEDWDLKYREQEYEKSLIKEMMSKFSKKVIYSRYQQVIAKQAGLITCGVNEKGEQYFVGHERDWENYYDMRADIYEANTD